MQLWCWLLILFAGLVEVLLTRAQDDFSLNKSQEKYGKQSKFPKEKNEPKDLDNQNRAKFLESTKRAKFLDGKRAKFLDHKRAKFLDKKRGKSFEDQQQRFFSKVKKAKFLDDKRAKFLETPSNKRAKLLEYKRAKFLEDMKRQAEKREKMWQYPYQSYLPSENDEFLDQLAEWYDKDEDMHKRVQRDSDSALHDSGSTEANAWKRLEASGSLLFGPESDELRHGFYKRRQLELNKRSVDVNNGFHKDNEEIKRENSLLRTLANLVNQGRLSRQVFGLDDNAQGKICVGKEEGRLFAIFCRYQDRDNAD